jgi:hypothetical protein
MSGIKQAERALNFTSELKPNPRILEWGYYALILSSLFAITLKGNFIKPPQNGDTFWSVNLSEPKERR